MKKEQEQLDTNISIHEIQVDDYSEIYVLCENTPGMGLSDSDIHESYNRNDFVFEKE